MDILLALLQPKQMEPLGLPDDPGLMTLLAQPLNLLPFNRRLSIFFEWPAFFTNNQHRCLFADVTGGGPTVSLNQAMRVPMRH